MKKCLLILLLVLLPMSCLAQVTATWERGGWTLSASYLNPNPTVGSSVEIPLTETYEIDGVAVTSVPVDVKATLTVGSSIVSKYWTSKRALTSLLTLESPVTTTDGEVKLNTDGTLRIKVNAPNDGKVHSITFRLIYKNMFTASLINFLVKAGYESNLAKSVLTDIKNG